MMNIACTFLVSSKGEDSFLARYCGVTSYLTVVAGRHSGITLTTQRKQKTPQIAVPCKHKRVATCVWPKRGNVPNAYTKTNSLARKSLLKKQVFTGVHCGGAQRQN
jgi:hypothetical protein